MNRFYFTPPSYSGHTLISAILDAHPSVVVDNVYGGELTTDQIIFNAKNREQWVGVKYNFSLKGQGENELPIRMIGRSRLYENFEELNPRYCISCIRHPRAIFKGYVMQNKIPRKDLIPYFYNLFFRISAYPSYVIVHEEFIHGDIKERLFNLCSYLNIAYDSEWAARAESLVRTDLPERDVMLFKEEMEAIDEMIDRVSLLGEHYGTKEE